MNAPEQATPQCHSGEIPNWLRSLIGIPLALLGGFTTTCFGIILCAYIVDRIGGGRPVLELFNFLFVWLFFGGAPLAAGIFLLRPTPSRKRFWWRVLLRLFLFFLVVFAGG